MPTKPLKGKNKRIDRHLEELNTTPHTPDLEPPKKKNKVKFEPTIPLKGKVKRIDRHIDKISQVDDCEILTVNDFIKLNHITERMTQRNISDMTINTILRMGKRYYYFKEGYNGHQQLGIKFVLNDYIIISIEKYLLTVIRALSKRKLNKLIIRETDGFVFEVEGNT